MGQKDTVTAKYMRKNQVFADAFNYFVYHGEQKIHPEELVELDTKEIELPYGADSTEKKSKAVRVVEEPPMITTDSMVATDSMAVTDSIVVMDSKIADSIVVMDSKIADSMIAADSKAATGANVLKNSKASKGAKTAKNSQKPVQKTRDVLKGIVAMKDQRSIYLILGIENQSHIHYAMPVRNMLYDALQYDKQVEEVIQSHRQANDYAKAKSDEFLSGFMKEDRIVPILTLVVYWNSKPWDGPMSIHEMCKDWDENIRAFVPDYRINLLAPASIEDEGFDKFHSSLKEVLSFIKYSGDKEQLEKYVQSNGGFHHIGRDEVNVLNTCVNAGISIDEEEGSEVDMCQALLDIKEEGILEGKQQGILEGKQQGMQLGIASIISMGRRHHFSDEEIIRELQLSMGITLQEAQKYLDNYKN